MARTSFMWRIGIDASAFNSGMSKLPKTAKRASEQVKKELGTVDLSTAVSNALGTGSDPSARISQVTGANVDQARQQLQMLTTYRDQLKGIGFDDNTTDTQYGLVSERIQELTYDIQAYEAELQRQSQAQSDTAQSAQAASSQTAAASRSAADACREQADAAEKVGNSSGFASTKIGRMLSSVGSVIRQARTYTAEADQNASANRRNAASMDKTSGAAGRVSSGLRKIGSSAKLSDLSLGRMVSSIRSVAVASFAFRIAGAAMGRLRSIVSEFISESPALQAQVNGLKSSMGQALSPAIQLVTNGLSALLPYIVGVSNAIGQLMGALFGSGWSTAAKGAKQTAAATSGAAKAQKEMNRQLLSFDELNKLSDNSSSSGGSGGGAGVDMTAIEAKTPAWMERFKSSFSELFSSEEFQASNIGGKIGMALQTGLDWLGTEAMHFDWRGAGKTLRENWDSFVGSGWVESLFQTVGIGLGGFADFVVGLMGPQWEELKDAYSEGGAMGAVGYISGIIVGLPGNLLSFAFESVLSPIFTGLADYFREHGNNSIAGFFQGCSEKMQAAGQWIRDNITDPIVNWVRNLFGIHSPSTVFSEIGSLCMTGLGGGFASGVSFVQEKLNDLKNRVFSIADSLKSAFSFQWRMPSLRLPHLSIDWEPVSNVVAQFFGVTAIPHLNVAWYAKGGILNGAQIFGRMGSTWLGGGEAGREAVLPLESNTEWMDTIAEKVVALLTMLDDGEQTIRIPVVLDGNVLTEVVAKGLRRRARATGGAGW